MAERGIKLDTADSDDSSNSGCDDKKNSIERKLVKSSSSYENLYDAANLEARVSEDHPPTSTLTRTLGDPIMKTILPPELCSSFENIYMIPINNLNKNVDRSSLED